MELVATEQAAAFIYRDGNPIALVLKNGRPTFYLVKEAEYKDVLEILEANRASHE